MSDALFAAGVLATAAVFALLEIQIEGSAGWATGLPTWRWENRWTRLLVGARAVTGYHLYVHLFVLLMAHAAFLTGIAEFTWRGEARIIAFLIFFWLAEDYLWFVFNPAFGARRFRREHVWWHAPTWWWIMPRDYWIFLPLGALLYLWSR